MTRAIILVAVMAVAGCGSDPTKTITQSSENAFHDGMQAFEKKQYEDASIRFDGALKNGGLNPDLVGQALLARAKCSIELGKLDAAAQDLEQARTSPSPPEEVLVLRAELANKQGDRDKARALIDKARKLNPAVIVPDTLNP